MAHLHTAYGSIIRDEVIKNLLSAHRRIAEMGEASEAIKLSKYLLRISKNTDNVFININSESNKKNDAPEPPTQIQIPIIKR